MSEIGGPLDDGGIDPRPDPMDLFHGWMKEAEAAEVNEANAMSLATVDADGRPDVRMVLLKAADANGFVFYSNEQSAKGRALAVHPVAALNFHWKSLRRAVRGAGNGGEVSDAQADAYFTSRPKDAQIGAWASAQSRPMEGRFVFEKQIAKYTAKYGLTMVPRPPYWTGWRVTPLRIEFWRDRPFRLHDRLVYSREHGAASWTTERLFP